MGGCGSLAFAAVIATGCRFGFDDAGSKDSGPIDANEDAATDGTNDPDAGSDAAIDASVTLCPVDYLPVVNETSKYRVLPGGTMGWLVAEQTCEAQGTHLVVLDSANEKAMMVSLLPATSMWTGVTDRKVVAQWVKVTGGEAAYLPWAASEPDEQNLECVQLEDLSTQLRDQGCLSGRQAICECDGLPAMPSTY